MFDRRLLACTALVPAGLVLLSNPAWANPRGGNVVAGSASIASAGSKLTVTQTSNRAVINWDSFSIASGEKTKFILPSSTAAVLNVVTGTELSSLLGHLWSNGQVYLLNPNGIVIGPNGRVNTAGFIASTLNASPDQFMQGGPLTLQGNSTASVVVLGSVKANNGDVLLVAAQVDNQGKLTAPNGEAILAAGSQVLYVPGDYANIAVAAPAPASGAAVSNTGMIAAAKVQLAAAGTPYQLAVNNGGQISATSVGSAGGHVVLQGGDGDIVNSGAIAATNGANGGTVALTGGRVALTSGAAIDVSAPAGGGTVTVAASNAISVAQGASINASATRQGNGGSVSIKAAKATQFAGSITATGGPQGGNGGQAEISGAGLLYAGSVLLTATSGTTGSVVFDPDEITIVSGSAAAPSGISGGLWGFTQDSGAQTITVGAIDTLLASANLELQATTSLTVAQPGTGPFASIASNTSNTLTLTAPTIAINAPISLPNGTLVFNWPDAAIGTYGYPQSLTSSSTATITAHNVQVAADFPTLTFGGAVVTPSLQFTAPTVQMSVSIANPGNAIQAVSFDPSSSGNTANSLDIETSSALTVSGNLQISFAGVLLAGGDLTLAAGTTLQGGPTLSLVSTGGVFNNLGGPNAIVTGNGQVLIYSATNGTGASGTAFNDGGIGAAAQQAQNYGSASGVSYPSSPNNIDTVVEYFTTTSSQPVLTISANSFTRTYGQADPTFTAQYSGGSGGGASELTTLPSFRIVQGNDVNAGTYTIQPYGAKSSTDLLNYIDGLLMVNPAPLVVTANNAIMTYGGTAPGFTYGVSGLVNGDASSIVSGVQFSQSPTASTPAGSYTLAPSNATVATPVGGTQPNYTISYQSGTLTVNPAPLTVSAVATNVAYGAAIPTLNLNFLGFVNAGDASSVPAQFVPIVSAVQGSNVGAYAITLQLLNPNSNYTVSYTGANLTITPAPLTITPNLTSTYGGTLPTILPTGDYSGFVNGDTPTSLGTLPMIATSASASSPAGSYGVTASGAVDSNYTIHYNTGTLTINPAPLTITPNFTKIYGAAMPTTLPLADFVGLVNGDTPASLTVQPGYSTSATAASNVGNYGAIASGAVDGNYSIGYAPGSFNITPAPLLIGANSFSRQYGASNPALTATYTGLVNNDGSAVVSGLTLATAATISSNVGTYAINGSGATAANYSITYAAGALTVTQAPLLITANDATRMYGHVDPAFSVSYNGLTNNDGTSVVSGLNIATSATVQSGVGSYAIVPSGGSAANYAISYASGTLSVTPALLLVKPSGTQVYYGTPQVTYTYTGFLNGDTAAALTTQPLFGTMATQASGVGNYVLNTFGATAANYSIQNVSGVLQVVPAPLSITANSFNVQQNSPLPALTGTFVGFRGPDTQASTGFGFTDPLAGSSVTLAGSYTITLTGSDPNYTVAYTPGTLTVSAQPIILNNTNTIDTTTTIQATSTVTVNPSLNQVTPSEALILANGWNIESSNEGPAIIQNYVNAINAAGGTLTVASIDAALNNPDTAAAMADLTNILQTPQSDWTASQQQFVEQVTYFIQAQRQAAALQAEADYAAWYQQTVKQEIAEIQSVSGPAQIDMAAIIASNPPIPPSSLIEEVQAGMDMTGSQLGSLSGIQTVTNTLASMASNPSALADYVPGVTGEAGEIASMTAKTALLLSGKSLTSADALQKAVPVLSKVFPTVAGNLKIQAVIDANIAKQADSTLSAAKTAAKTTEEAVDIAGTVGRAFEVGGAIAEVVGNVLQIAVSAADYGQVATFNTNFNNAVAAANQPVTAASLQSMLNSTSGTQQLYSYLGAMLATGGTTPLVNGPDIPASVYESQQL
jgi:filamentous hemagglutinin family protein